MKNINLLLPNPLLIYHEKFSPRIADRRLPALCPEGGLKKEPRFRIKAG